MRLLSFKRKSKKRNTETLESGDLLPGLELDGNVSSISSSSGASPISFHSPIADLFMVTYSIPDVTANNLMDEILSELPTQDKVLQLASDNNISAPKKFEEHSSKVDPTSQDNRSTSDRTYYYDGDNNNLAKNHYQAALNQDVISERNLHMQGPVYTHDAPSSETLACSKSESSASLSSLSSTEEYIALHHISRSDPHSEDPNVPANHDTIPLIKLIQRSNDLKTANAIVIDENGKFTSNQQLFPQNYTKSTIQRSPGFVIDRMKERHRQECRRSWQGPLTVPGKKIVQPVRRASSLLASSKNLTNEADHIQLQNFLQWQQQQQQFPLLDDRFTGKSPQLITAVPLVNKNPLLIANKNIIPLKSYSTIHNRQHRESIIASKIQSRQLRIMKPIQEYPLIPEPLLGPEHKQFNIKPSSSANSYRQGISVAKCGIKDGVTNKPARPNYVDVKTGCNGYTNPTCHAKQVTQLHHTSSVVSKQNRASVTTCNSNREQVHQVSESSSAIIASTALPTETESAELLSNIFRNQLNTSSKLKAQYRRMQIIHATRSYSVPEFSKLSNSDIGIDEAQRRNSLENNKNIVAIPVGLISKDRDLKRKGVENTKTNEKKPCHHLKRSGHCHQSHKKPYLCHHLATSICNGYIHDCCTPIRYVHSNGCKVNHTLDCKFSFRQAAACLNTKTPPKIDGTTSPSASEQPQVVQNIDHCSPRNDRKKLNLCNLHRPVCRTCRH